MIDFPNHRSVVEFKLVFIGTNVLNASIIMLWQVVVEHLFLSLVKAVCLLLSACSCSVVSYFHTDSLSLSLLFFGKTEIQIHIIIETGAILVIVSPTEIIRNIFM